jgi:apolipoprotein N-acyltransferase
MNFFRILFAIILSGVCFYFSLGLSGNYGFLFWIAPVPVLILSFKSSAGRAFIIAFIAYLLGRLSWFSYLITVATLVPAIIFAILLSLIFALIVMAARRVVIETDQWYSVFAFPALFTAFEFLILKFSRDGSAGSIAYSQSNILPVIQIASLTGILGITFFMTLIPSAIATAWFFRKHENKFRYVVICCGIIIAFVPVFGMIRMIGYTANRTIKAGLAVLDEKSHYITQHPDVEKEKRSAEDYAIMVSHLADDGAKLIVLPERALNINGETEAVVMNALSNIAKEKNVFIVTGYTNFKTNVPRNSALTIDTSGTVVLDYNKVHLVTGFEKQFTPGGDIGLSAFNNFQNRNSYLQRPRLSLLH